MLALLIALDLATAPASPCSGAAIAAALQTAIARADAKDAAAAKAAIAPVATCPATTVGAFSAHVLRADLAVREGDWAAATAALDGIGHHPELRVARLAGFLRLRADQGTGDAAAFARDRAALVAANDAALAAAGRRVETFRAGAATVTGYEAAIDQGAFHRTVEFIAVPDDPAAYPASVLLTDDRTAVQVAGELAKPGEPKREHVWFFDLYTCGAHSTLSPPVAGDAPPSFADLKTRVVALGTSGAFTPAGPPPDKAVCWSSQWLLPGLGSGR